MQVAILEEKGYKEALEGSGNWPAKCWSDTLPDTWVEQWALWGENPPKELSRKETWVQRLTFLEVTVVTLEPEPKLALDKRWTGGEVDTPWVDRPDLGLQTEKDEPRPGLS